MPELSILNSDAATLEACALVVGVVAGDEGKATVSAAGLSADVVTACGEIVDLMKVGSGVDSVTRVPAPAGVAAKTVVFTGLGDSEKITSEILRRSAGAASRSLNGTDKAVFALPAADAAAAGAVAEGALLGAYVYLEQKSTEPEADALPVKEVVVVSDAADVDAATKRAVEIARAVHDARDLVNCPPNKLYPESFAAHAEKLGNESGLKVTILDDETLAAEGYGGLTAVGMGSARKPRLAKLEWAPKGAEKHVAIVGKGVTFDTGGISLKPSQSMEDMKSDMAGAAATLNTVLVAARLNVPVKVTAYLCLAENMPSSVAQRPSDIITILGGKTVEVLNTDAEGRLVMADGLVAASRENPDAILDIATLTGAQVVALGTRVAGVMGDDELREAVVASATESGEQFWGMPLPEELMTKLKSPVADLTNLGDRWGGMLSAGLFLREFVGKVGGEDAADDAPRIPWAHLDIAGPSYSRGDSYGYATAGGTGIGVRTMLTLIESYAK